MLAEPSPKDGSKPVTLISKTASLELRQLRIMAFSHPQQKQLDSDAVLLFSLKTHSSSRLAPGSTFCTTLPAMVVGKPRGGRTSSKQES